MAEIKFEKALGRLEEIVEELQAGNMGLEESLKVYEEGVKLAHICTKKLDSAQKKVERLTKTQDGSFLTEPFDPEEESMVSDKELKSQEKKGKSKLKKLKQNEEGTLF